MNRQAWSQCGLRRGRLLATLVFCLFEAPAFPAATAPPGHEPSAAERSPKEPPLRVSEPVASVIADLKLYIPTRMRQEDIPGLAIAIVREGKVAWTAGFGVSNRITKRPVEADSLFEVASISKVVTTYAALRVVEQGKLSLDEPLVKFLRRRWLPPSEDGDRITLRHLASHSSGLTDNLLFPVVDKTLAFAPGSAFRYSGIGFMYMQDAVEQVTGQPLEEATRELVFEPLGMSSSSLVNRSDLLPRNANGHIACTVPVLVFLLPFAAILLPTGLAGVLLARILKHTWRPTRRMALGVCFASGLLALATVLVLLGRPLPNFTLLAVLCATVFAALLAALFQSGLKILARLLHAHARKSRWSLMTVWSALSLFALLRVSGLVTVPVPRSPSPPPSAVGSLRSSAGDLARLLIELSEPSLLSSGIAAQIRAPQISAGDGFSWGLGIGIQHADQGNSLWQNGQTLGFRSLMVIYPQHRIGVVVLTNSDHGLPAAHDVVQRALGGKARWKYF